MCCFSFRYFIFVKAAPEEIIKHCTRIATAAGVAPVTESIVNEFTVRVEFEARMLLFFFLNDF